MGYSFKFDRLMEIQKVTQTFSIVSTEVPLVNARGNSDLVPRQLSIEGYISSKGHSKCPANFVPIA